MEDLDTWRNYLIDQIQPSGLGQTAPNPVLSTLRYFRT